MDAELNHEVKETEGKETEGKQTEGKETEGKELRKATEESVRNSNFYKHQGGVAGHILCILLRASPRNQIAFKLAIMIQESDMNLASSKAEKLSYMGVKQRNRHTHTHIYIYTYLHIYIYIFQNIHLHIHIHIYIYTYINIHIHIHIYIYMYKHICQQRCCRSTHPCRAHTCTHAFRYLCISNATKRAEVRPTRKSGTRWIARSNLAHFRQPFSQCWDERRLTSLGCG